MRERASGLVRWVFAPATEDGRLQDVGFMVLRITLGLMWLYNVVWKRAPDFGRDAGSGLYRFTEYGVTYPVLAPYAWLVENALLPAIVPLGYAVLAAETTLAVLLLTGLFLRVGALLGVAQSVAIALSVLYAPNEWPWAYYLMIVGHVALLLGASGRLGTLDGARRARVVPTRQVQVWAGLATVAGLWSIVGSRGDPLGAVGVGFHNFRLEVSLGIYNLLGGAVLVAIAVLLWLALRGSSRPLALTAAAIATLAALSVHAQLGFTDPTLGASPTSAGSYLCLAVVAGFLARAFALPTGHLDVGTDDAHVEDTHGHERQGNPR